MNPKEDIRAAGKFYYLLKDNNTGQCFHVYFSQHLAYDDMGEVIMKDDKPFMKNFFEKITMTGSKTIAEIPRRKTGYAFVEEEEEEEKSKPSIIVGPPPKVNPWTKEGKDAVPSPLPGKEAVPSPLPGKEAVPAPAPAPAPEEEKGTKHCGTCGKTGHNKLTCQQEKPVVKKEALDLVLPFTVRLTVKQEGGSITITVAKE